MATTTTTTQDAFPIFSFSSSSSLALTDSSATAAGQEEEGPTRTRRSPRALSNGEAGADAATVNNGGRAPRKLRPRGNVCMQCREQKVGCVVGLGWCVWWWVGWVRPICEGPCLLLQCGL